MPAYMTQFSYTHKAAAALLQCVAGWRSFQVSLRRPLLLGATVQWAMRNTCRTPLSPGRIPL